MSSRRRGGNTDNFSPVVTRTYELRGRTKNVVQQSSVNTNTTSETDPQTPEPGNQGDFTGFVRTGIKNAGKEKKDRTVEQYVKNKSTRTTKPVESNIDNDSDDGSDYSNSGGGLSKNNRQSPTISSFRSSAEMQPSQPNSTSIQFNKYTGDNTKVSILRPRIGLLIDGDKEETQQMQYKTGSAKKQSSQVWQPIKYTNDDKKKTNYYSEESWRDSTKTLSSQSRSEYDDEDDEEEESFQYQRKSKDQLNETTRYKEERGAWKDHGEESILYHRYQQKPKENTKALPAQSRASVGFSDDDEETTHHQHKTASIVKKPPTKSFIHFAENMKALPVQSRASVGFSDDDEETTRDQQKRGTCMNYLALVLLVLIVGSAAVLYISPVSVLKMIGQVTFVDELQVKKDFKDDFEKLATIFTHQSELMWNRSRRILDLHLQNWKENKEPAIILLTGALDAEQTLLCLGTRLANIYSSFLRGGYTVISGSDWASGNNDEVKEYIDNNLNAGFQATTRAAVLHRLELLPAGSLLILYKYCDHESAVFKDVMLLFTVLLDDATLEEDILLKDLEEKVRAFLIQKLIVPGTGTSHDGMDEDKFSGVWSRISHVVLPVFPEKNMEQCGKKPN